MPYDEHDHHGHSLSPDYADPHLRAALVHFIAALGARYDGDPRIGFIQFGLLGFWGEWHTFPHSGGEKSDGSLAADVQEQILAAFGRTIRLAREPKADFLKNYSLGYHDDSFAYQTLTPPDWHYQGKLARYGETDRWRTQPIGGEIRPEIQPGLWQDPSVVPVGQEYSRCVRHADAAAHGRDFP